MVKFDLNSFYVMRKSSRGLGFRQPVTSLMLVGFSTPHEAFWLKLNTPETSNIFKSKKTQKWFSAVYFIKKQQSQY